MQPNLIQQFVVRGQDKSVFLLNGRELRNIKDVQWNPRETVVIGDIVTQRVRIEMDATVDVQSVEALPTERASVKLDELAKELGCTGFALIDAILEAAQRNVKALNAVKHHYELVIKNDDVYSDNDVAAAHRLLDLIDATLRGE